MSNAKSLFAASLLGLSLLAVSPVFAAGSLVDGSVGSTSTGTATLEAVVPQAVVVDFNQANSDTDATIVASQIGGGADPGAADNFVINGNVNANTPNAILAVTDNNASTATTLNLVNGSDTITATISASTFNGINNPVNGSPAAAQPAGSAFNLAADIDEASIGYDDAPGAYTVVLTYTATPSL